MTTQEMPKTRERILQSDSIHIRESVVAVEHLGNGSSRIEFALSYFRHLDNLRAYVEQRWNEPIRLADAADSIGISASRLSYIFHDKTGIRFSDWLRRVRVERAQELLRVNDISICDVALSVGFRNTRSFERAFKKTYGKTATKFRKDMIATMASDE